MQITWFLWMPILFLLLLLPLNIKAETANEVFEIASESTVVIFGYDRSRELTSQGSGVVLPDGTVATNCHVIGDFCDVTANNHDCNHRRQKPKIRGQ